MWWLAVYVSPLDHKQPNINSCTWSCFQPLKGFVFGDIWRSSHVQSQKSCHSFDWTKIRLLLLENFLGPGLKQRNERKETQNELAADETSTFLWTRQSLILKRKKKKKKSGCWESFLGAENTALRRNMWCFYTLLCFVYMLSSIVQFVCVCVRGERELKVWTL